MVVPPHIRTHIEALRAFLVLNSIPALVVPAVGPEQPCKPLRLCPHCRLPVGSTGSHGACEQAEREVSG